MIFLSEELNIFNHRGTNQSSFPSPDGERAKAGLSPAKNHPLSGQRPEVALPSSEDEGKLNLRTFVVNLF